MKNSLFKMIFITHFILLFLLLNNCLIEKQKEKASTLDEGNVISLVDCSMLPEAEKRQAYDESGGDYGISSNQRILYGSGFKLMQTIDASDWATLSLWLDAQKNNTLKEYYLQKSPGNITDRIKKSTPNLVKAFYCLNKETAAKIETSTSEHEIKLAQKLKASCKDALESKPKIGYSVCRDEYMSIYLALLALENGN